MYGYIKKTVITLIGTGIMGFALAVFLVPLGIAPGGVSGLATVISRVSGLRVGTLIILINIPLFVLGFLSFNKVFLVYSLMGAFFLSVSAEVFSVVPQIITDMLPASVFGGGLMGAGLGIVLRSGGTTGGTDILAVVLKKVFPSISVGDFFLIIDGAVIAVAGLVSGSLEIVMYSALAVSVSSKALDFILAGADFANMVYIISDNSADIAQKILTELKRGVTGLNSVSFYRGENKLVLLCILRKTEVPKLKKLILELDENAFMIISDAREVLGNGFNRKN